MTDREEQQRIERLTTLSEDQRKILMWYTDGLTQKEIAKRLTIAVGTVKHHLGEIYARLEISGDQPHRNRQLLAPYADLLRRYGATLPARTTSARRRLADPAPLPAEQDAPEEPREPEGGAVDPGTRSVRPATLLWGGVALLVAVVALWVAMSGGSRDPVGEPADVTTAGCVPQGEAFCLTEPAPAPPGEALVVDFLPPQEGIHHLELQVAPGAQTMVTLCWKASRDEAFSCWRERDPALPLEGWRRDVLCTGRTDMTYRIRFDDTRGAPGDVQYRFRVMGNIVDLDCKTGATIYEQGP